MSTSFSFKFTKNTRTKLSNGVASTSTLEIDEETENGEIVSTTKHSKITSLDANGFAVVDEESDDEEIIIPPLPNTLTLKSNAQTLDDLAKNALIEDALRLTNGAAKEDDEKLYGSMVVRGADENRHLDLADLPDVADEADYQAVPVSAYGKALLRGLGWKDGQPIGKSSKKTVVPVVTAPRPKGLGLGAKLPEKKTKKQEKSIDGASTSKEEQLTLKVGAYFKNTKDEYGEIVGLDVDNSRIFVKMALDKGSTKTLSQHAATLVGREEYEKNAKCINKRKYDEYKEKEKKIDEVSDDKDEKQRNGKDKERNIKENTQDRKRDRSRQKSEEKKSERSFWLSPELRVRIVDEKYGTGKYYKQKVVVVDVTSRGVCTCIADDHRTLEDLRQSQLETVVPRQGSVMVVGGRHSGKLGTLVERDIRRCRAVVQLVDGNAAHVDFDDICEFVGEIGE